MIDTLHIRNFKSLKNIRFDLQKINLFIGPNNSGKTNALSALTFLFNTLLGDLRENLEENFKRFYFGINESDVFSEPISFTFKTKINESHFEYYIFEFWGLTPDKKIIKRELIAETRYELPDDFNINRWKDHENIFLNFNIQVSNNSSISATQLQDIQTDKDYFRVSYTKNQPRKAEFISGVIAEKPLFSILNTFRLGQLLMNISENIHIYQPDPFKIKTPVPLDTDSFISFDAANLVSFLDNMRDEYPDIYEHIKKDLTECLSEIRDIRFKKVKSNNQITKQIGVVDSDGRIFWSDELSEGILYFLALLAIIHQPQPPRLLLIEEPEKGIHPRRLHEIMQFIFELADNKDIQIILTSHSPLIVNEFEEIPESVFVFDIENGETKVRNLFYEIIEPSNKKSEKTSFPKIDYTQTIGEHWVYGFLGGIPK